MQIVWLILFYIYTIFGYKFITSLPNSNQLTLPIDNIIPLVPVFAVPYLFATFMFLATPLILYIICGWEKTKPYLIVQTVATTAAYAIYTLFPMSTVRPEIAVTDIFTGMVAFVYSADSPTALFPSGHVYMSVIISYFFWRYFPKTRVWIVVILPLIILSTVFIRQHHVLDILGGLLIAVASIGVYQWLEFRINSQHNKKA